MSKAFDDINRFLNDSHHFYTISINPESIYSYVSPNYDRNFGQKNETLLGKHFSVTLHPDDVEKCGEAGLRCLQNPEQ